MAGLVGLNVMKGKLRRFAFQYPYLVGEAIVEELKVELEESNRRIPKDTGAAMESGQVVGPVVAHGAIAAGIAYGMDPRDLNPKSGTPVAAYIIPLHENLDAHHENGEAKFLESTLRESEPYIGERILRRVGVEKVKL